MDASDTDQTLRQAEPSAATPLASGAGEAPGLQPVARANSRPSAPVVEPVAPGALARPALRWFLVSLKALATLAIALVAIVMALVTWSYYVTAPWTRDGTVRVQVASVAPQVSGQITELRVGDNQYVHKGDVLYVIDPFDFQVALRTGQAQLQQSAADLQVKQVQSDRRQRLTSLATTPEEQQTFAGTAVDAKAAFDAAQQQVAQAEINLRRTQVLSPVNGYVTNLLMRVGDYAHQGEANVSVIDTDSYWIDGYFEETKMARVCVGDRVEAKLMGYAQPILGHVATVTRGIGVSNAAAGVQGLPNVDPVYTWVRLAQRVPVRIAIDSVPSGIPLVSGMTATVTAKDAADIKGKTGLGRAVAEVLPQLSDVLNGPSARPGCIPAVTTGQASTESLPVDQEEPAPSPDQLNPGLAPGLDKSPTDADIRHVPR
ncbi:MAG: efflux RND transporter periplasmic adaptor subunit [Inquilinus sp.]|uniref:efflux RND transporter periplasmic adaptor subunit n=1 Tax=Inquilinus sp. TaxID=1932117 RepID=UPI003F2B9123